MKPYDLGEYALGLKLQGGDAAKWGERIEALLGSGRDVETMTDDLDKVMAESDLDDLPALDDYRAALGALAERYHFVRQTMLEEFELDLSAENYREPIGDSIAKGRAALAMAAGVRNVLIAAGALDEDETDPTYIVALLGALLPAIG